MYAEVNEVRLFFDVECPLYVLKPADLAQGRDPDTGRRAIANPAGNSVFSAPLYQGLSVLSDLGKIAFQTLILAGKADPFTPVEDAEEIAAHIADELVELCVVEGAGHGVWWDAP